MPTLADLSRLSTEEAGLLLHGAIHEMCGTAGSYAPGAKSLVVKYQAMFQDATAKGLAPEEVQLRAEAAGVAPEYAAVVGSTFASRQLDLAKAMRDASSSIAAGHLKDFDWKVQVMLSSDKMSEIRQPVLSLKMDVETAVGPGGKGAEESVVVEMTKDEVDAVLRSMDAAYQHMEKLKA